jgi:hypothetical protein
MHDRFFENDPEEATSSPRMVSKLLMRLKESGSVADRPHTGQKRSTRNEEVSVNILAKVIASPFHSLGKYSRTVEEIKVRFCTSYTKTDSSVRRYILCRRTSKHM